MDEFHSKVLPVILVRQVGCGPISSILNRRDTDCVVDKSKPDRFTLSEFVEIFTKIETSNMVIKGLMSNACVQATYKGAFRNDYSVQLIENALE